MINKKIFLVIIIAFSFSFSIKKEKKFIPPGTTKITETFFADETEVSNFSWREYEAWTRNKYGKDSKEYLEVLPDTTVWRDKNAFNEPYVKHYYRNFAYKDYPVVGISYEQAIAFCKWRSGRVKEFYYLKNKKELSIEYRLPTKEEWEMLSAVPPFYLNNGGRNKKGEMQLNIASSPKDSVASPNMIEDNADVTAPVYSYEKNLFGLFNLHGNVAEMISQKGLSKGGSWTNSIEECRAGKEIIYTEPKAWLGFRCVCILTK